MKLIDLLNRTEISSFDFFKIIFKQRLIKFCILPLTKSSMNDFRGSTGCKSCLPVNPDFGQKRVKHHLHPAACIKIKNNDNQYSKCNLPKEYQLLLKGKRCDGG